MSEEVNEDIESTVLSDESSEEFDLRDAIEDGYVSEEEYVEENEDSEYERLLEDEGICVTHSYMGRNMQDVCGRNVLCDGNIIELPLIYRSGVVVFPGQILPLKLSLPSSQQLVTKILEPGKTFGFVFKRASEINESLDMLQRLAPIGVTMEVSSVKLTERWADLVAYARQRFKLLELTQTDGVFCGKVEILSSAEMECSPQRALLHTVHTQPNHLRSEMIASRYHLKNRPWKEGENRYQAKIKPLLAPMLYSSLTPIPSWVYKQYDSYFVMDCLVKEIKSWNTNFTEKDFPIDPTEFSYWMASNLPLTMEMRIKLVCSMATITRLRLLKTFMEKCGSTLACARCVDDSPTKITDKKHIFSLTQRTPTGIYVNATGFVHEVVTCHKADHVTLSGRPSTHYSWFPGYAWTIASCELCGHHIGWKFTAARPELHPKKFWGLTRNALAPVFVDAPG